MLLLQNQRQYFLFAFFLKMSVSTKWHMYVREENKHSTKAPLDINSVTWENSVWLLPAHQEILINEWGFAGTASSTLVFFDTWCVCSIDTCCCHALTPPPQMLLSLTKNHCLGVVWDMEQYIDYMYLCWTSDWCGCRSLSEKGASFSPDGLDIMLRFWCPR